MGIEASRLSVDFLPEHPFATYFVVKCIAVAKEDYDIRSLNLSVHRKKL